MKIPKYYGKVHCSQDNPMVSLKDVKNLLRKEKETWANQSIGWKAVESIEKCFEDEKCEHGRSSDENCSACMLTKRV